MEKNDLQNSRQETNNITTGDKNATEQTNQETNASNSSRSLQAGLGRDLMQEVDERNRSNKNDPARDFGDLKNEKLNASNDE